MKKTIIFFPFEVGLAHLTRSFALAQNLQRKGHTIIFAIPERKISLFQSKGITLVPIKPYIEKDGLDYISKLKNIDFLLEHAQEEMKLLKRYKPDCAVIDFRMSAVASCSTFGLPIFFLAGSGGLPYGCHLPNPKLPAIFHKILSPLLEYFIWNMRMEYIKVMHKTATLLGYTQKMEHMLQNMEYLIPEPQHYLPSKKTELKTHYVGPMFWKEFERIEPNWLSEMKRDGNTIYITFGGTGFDPKKMLALANHFLQKDYRVIVSTGDIIQKSAFPKHKKLFVEKYLPGGKISKIASVIVCHGDYGTLMEGILAKTPIVSIPYNPDQLLHSLRLQELSLVWCLSKFNVQVVKSLIKLNLKDFQNKGTEIEIGEIDKTIDEIFTKKNEYRSAIQLFCKKFPIKDGVEGARCVIEKYFD